MAMTADEVRNKTFRIVKKGYERGEVHRFLDGLAGDIQAIASGDAPSDAIVVVAEQMTDADPEVVAATVTPADSAAAPTVRGFDDFDRVGNEISLMLRQAQESALKIRNDAEVEATTLVDQVRLDIEADRSAHEQAAQELIGRTEERAGTLRTEAESYADETRSGADDYSGTTRSDAEQVLREAEQTATADTDRAADALEVAHTESEAMVADASQKAESIVTDAKLAAQEQSEQLLGEARATLATMIEAETGSRHNLEEARGLIDDALAQTTLSDFDLDAIAVSVSTTEPEAPYDGDSEPTLNSESELAETETEFDASDELDSELEIVDTSPVE